MPINRNGKHWCDPSAEQPHGRANSWTCPDCKTRWKFWPDQNVWATSDVDVPAQFAPTAQETPEEGAE